MQCTRKEDEACSLFRNIIFLSLWFTVTKFPFKAITLQSLNTFLIHIGRLAREEEFVLTSLPLDPDSQFAVLGKVGWNIAMSESVFVCDELVASLLPGSHVTIPDEAYLVQDADALISHCGSIAFRSKLVLVSLPFDPSCQGRIVLVGMRNLAVQVLKRKE
jgi:hypothetical protein